MADGQSYCAPIRELHRTQLEPGRELDSIIVHRTFDSKTFQVECTIDRRSSGPTPSSIEPSKCTPHRRGSQVTELLQTTIYWFKTRDASVDLLGRRRRTPPLFHGSPEVKSSSFVPGSVKYLGHTTEYYTRDHIGRQGRISCSIIASHVF